MSTYRSALVAFVLALLASVPAVAQRTLSWEALDVRAELDGGGKLHVTERHTMLFDGDWNGGERTFRVERGQALEVEEVSRIDADGTVHPMTRGNLDEVDHWDMADKALRWRSRLPSDPPFANQRLIYDIRYTLDRVLVPQGGNAFKLNHDFAFPERPAPVQNFAVKVTFSPEWSGPPNGVVTGQASNIPAGKGFVLRVPLRFGGQVAPSAVPLWEVWFRKAGAWLMLVPAVILLLLFFFSERERLKAVELDTDPIDHDWLRRNLFAYAPEVAGMIFDGKVGPPEVAAMLASMERDGKVRSKVVPGRKRKPDLELELLVPLSTLEDRQASLAYAIFGSSNKVKASELRAAHKSTGFDLPAIVRDSIARDAEMVAPGTTPVWRSGLAAAFFVSSIAALVIAIWNETANVLALFLILFGGIAIVLLAIGAAKRWRENPGTYAAIRLIVPGALFWLFAQGCQRLDSASGGFTFHGVAALALFLGGFYTILLDAARQRMSKRGMRVYMQLGRAQAWFRLELQKATPDIRDEWMPWLIALNLDETVSAWWKTFGAQRASTIGVSTPMSSSTSSRSSDSFGSSSSPSASEFSAAGGRFGGAGSTGSWTAAASALAAPISAPSASSGSSSSSDWSSSSGSSSSSDSSSSSSGGGGGGGW